jgi:hypothetical protein
VQKALAIRIGLETDDELPLEDTKDRGVSAVTVVAPDAMAR